MPKTREGVDLALADVTRHPVREYLRSLIWDGEKRCETLFIDYLGAEDSRYTRTVTRKALIGAAARILSPGCKHDHMLVLIGPQGCRKSTTLKKLGKEWFSDSLYTMSGKDAYEQLQGFWIIELSEIINKETNEVRLVVSIDEENRKIHSVPADEPNAEPSIMAAASYDRRWKLYEEPEAEVSETAEPEVNHDEPMKMSDVVTKLESLFDILNRVYFDNALPKPVITVQSTPKAYGHCSTKKIWKSENDGQYEINIGAEFLNRPSANTAATMCHEMVHLYCLVNEIQDTCQKGRYHNKTFKAEAEARDLEIGYDRTVGFSHTNPTEAFKKTLEDNGFVLEVPFARVMPEEKAKAEREKPHRYVCPVCGQEVKTTADLSLICGICEVAMERAD